MRICLVAHGFPPLERSGVENYTASLARTLARRGHRVLVFAPRAAKRLPELSLRTEEREGYRVHWLTTNRAPAGPEEMLDLPGAGARFGELLDLERPEVVHFQHVLKLGLSLVEETHARGLPAVYTAHDYYSVCHRFTLLRPDLARCDDIGRPELCARCDLALALLNRHSELGDYMMGVLEGDLDAPTRAALDAVLAGEPERAGFAAGEWEASLERRHALDARRREVVSRFDAILAPPRFLAGALERGGIDPARIRHLPYGIDAEPLRALAPPHRSEGRPLRFGFLGSLTKHKGVHVLLEAFERLGPPAELRVWGGSTDTVYRRRVEVLAARGGARLMGPFDAAALPRCLAAVDVVVVPSIWVENYPISIREAFAARRPVIASRVGALPESVREGVDGLLFEPGDPAALAEAMGRLVREPELLERLVAGIEPVKDMEEQAAELLRVYEELLARPRPESALPDLPEHLRQPLARHRELASLPASALFARSLAGLGRLRRGLLGPQTDADLEGWLERALGRDSKAQIYLRDLRHEGEWLRETVAGHEEAERALAERVRWREEELAVLRDELDWRRREQDTLSAQRDWLAGEVAGREEELVWLRGERERFLEKVRHLEHEGARMRERLRLAAELGLAALEAQEHFVGSELGHLFGQIDSLASGSGPPAEGDGSREPRQLGELVGDVRRSADRLDSAAAELEWRRAEMDEALRVSRRRLASLLLRRTGLGRRVAGWNPAVGGGTSEPEAGP